MRLFFHPDVTPAKADELDQLRWRIEYFLAHGGPWVRAMAGPFDRTLRIRVGSRRALFSWRPANDPLGGIWIHEVGWRREIYDRQTGLARVGAWSRAEASGVLLALGYRLHPEAPPPARLPDLRDTEILPTLSVEQAQFVRKVLPVDDADRGQLTFVVRADGPPGSGKTVVAADCARDAFRDSSDSDGELGQGGADVVVLVPSGSLLRSYRDELRNTALPEPTPFAAAPEDTKPRIWIERFDDFFAAFADGWDPDRQSQREAGLREWWDRQIRVPTLQRWQQRHPCVAQPRFLELLDACFGDRETPGGGAKDALHQHDAPLYAALAALTPGERNYIERARREAGLTFRCEMARQSRDALASCRPGRSILFVVDEAQDLIPAQWESLVAAALRRNLEERGLTLVALLGDENQRVSPTAFAWSEVHAFISALHPSLAQGAGMEQAQLTGSFRNRREVARVANTLVDGSLSADKTRRARVADPDELKAGGRVVVVVSDDPAGSLRGAVDAIRPRLGADDRIVCVGQELPQVDGLDTMEIVEAKGLEYARVVVAGAFRPPLDWDTRSRGYVALTRARDAVTVVLHPTEWEAVRHAWHPLIQAASPSELHELLYDSVIAASAADDPHELKKRISSLVDDADRANGAFPVAVMERAARLVQAGTPEPLVAFLDDALARRSAWRATMLSFAADPTQEALQRVAAWLLLGDVGAALRCARVCGLRPAVLAPLEALSAEDGPLAQASLELRARPNEREDAHLVDLLTSAFWTELQARWKDGRIPAVSRHRLTNRPSDVVARAALTAIDDAATRVVGNVDAADERRRQRGEQVASRIDALLRERRATRAVARQRERLEQLRARVQGEV